MKTLEQVIAEASKGYCEDAGYSAAVMVSDGEMRRIAAAVREWMDGDLVTFASVRARDRAARINELEAEVERLTKLECRYLRMLTGEETRQEMQAVNDKAAKYEELRARFPYLPGEDVWVLYDGAIRPGTVLSIKDASAWIDTCGGIKIEVDISKIKPNPEACRAAIPVWPKD